MLRDQVGVTVPRDSIRLVDVQSHVSGDVDREDVPPHWDICFLYRTRVPEKAAARLSRPDWFSELAFKPLDRLKRDDFTRGHGDVLEAARMIGTRQKSRH